MFNPELVDGILALDPDALKDYFELSGVKVVSIRIGDIEEIKGLLSEGFYVSSLLNEKLELGGYLVSEVMKILGDNYYRVKK